MDVNARVSSNELVKPGKVVSGVVEQVTADAVVIDVTAQGHFKGTISPQHLADHTGECYSIESFFFPPQLLLQFPLCYFLCTICIN